MFVESNSKNENSYNIIDINALKSRISSHIIMIIEIYYGLLFFFLNSVLRPFQDYFSSYETGQSVGGAKMGEPREKTPDTPASRTWLVSHVGRTGLKSTPDTAVR